MGGLVSIVSYGRLSPMIIALKTQFHVYLPLGQRPFSIVRGGAAKFGLISITYHKYILGVYKYILRLEISIFDRKNR